MSDAFNAAAWILGELDDPIANVKNSLFKPTKIKVDNIDKVNVGDPVDFWLNKANPRLLPDCDDNAMIGKLITNQPFMMPTDLLKTVDNGDGTVTALFFPSYRYCVKFVLDKETMLPIDYSEGYNYDYFGLTSSGMSGYSSLYDYFYDKESDTDFFLASSTSGSATAAGYVYKKNNEGAKKYTLTLPSASFQNIILSNSNAATKREETKCEGGRFRKIGENLFLMSIGRYIHMIALNDSNSTVNILYTFTLPLAGSTSLTAGNAIMYIDKEKNLIYAFGNDYPTNKNTLEVFLYVLEYDTEDNTISLLKSASLYTGRLLIYSMRQDAIMKNDGGERVIPVFGVEGTSATLLYVTFDSEHNPVVEAVTLPSLFNAYDVVSPIAVDPRTVIYSYRSDDATTKFVKVVKDRAITEKSATVDSGYMYRLAMIDDCLMYFCGMPGNGAGKSGNGTCDYLYKAVAGKLGVVIGKDEETGEVEVAQSGIVPVNAEGTAGQEVTTKMGTFGKYIDKHLFELYGE